MTARSPDTYTCHLPRAVGSWSHPALSFPIPSCLTRLSDPVILAPSHSLLTVLAMIAIKILLRTGEPMSPCPRPFAILTAAVSPNAVSYFPVSGSSFYLRVRRRA